MACDFFVKSVLLELTLEEASSPIPPAPDTGTTFVSTYTTVRSACIGGLPGSC